jgi:O-antigen/teichoic acid export membrane protein
MFFTVAFLAQLLSNVIVYFVSNKMFPDYIPEGIVNPEARKHINRRIRDLFTAKLGGTITNSAVSVVISSVLGLTVLAQYNNYYYILSALFGFMTIIFQSSLAGIGNSLVLDSREKNYKDFEVFSFLLSWIIGFFTVCLYCLLQPFMEIWVHAQNMFSDSYVILFCIYFYVYELALVWATYKDAGGIWHGDRYRPLCVTIVNLGLNLLTVRRLGLIGVIGSTVVSYVVVGMPWMLHNIFTMLFQKKMRHYVAKCLYGILITLIGCLASSFVCQNVQINGLLGLIFKIVIVAIIANVVFIIAYYKTVEFGKAKNLLTRLLMSYRMGR